jgi:polar amino acid transport system substrate-binding protein
MITKPSKLRLALALAVVAVTAGACGGSSNGNGTTGTGGGADVHNAVAAVAGTSCSYSNLQADVVKAGHLTVATDSPAYWPWFYKNNPSDGSGYESAVAYEVASLLGFKRSQVKWVVEPFDASYQPGPKHFDFDINEISVSAARAQAVTFSTSYYDVQQALVSLRGTPIVSHHTPADLKNYVFGDQIGTTSLQFINDQIQPTHTPDIFDTLNDVKSALQAHRIAALVVDTPTAQYIASSEIPHATMVAQFPSTGEHYGMLFAKGDKLATCVDAALSIMKKNGFLAAEVKKYLGQYTYVPTIKP